MLHHIIQRPAHCCSVSNCNLARPYAVKQAQEKSEQNQFNVIRESLLAIETATAVAVTIYSSVRPSRFVHNEQHGNVLHRQPLRTKLKLERQPHRYQKSDCRHITDTKLKTSDTNRRPTQPETQIKYTHHTDSSYSVSCFFPLMAQWL